MNTSRASSRRHKKGKSGQLLTKTDLILIMNGLEKGARHAVESMKSFKGSTKAENDIVFNWCQEAVEEMMHVMSLHN